MANITSQMVKELREMTQAGMMDCKKALVEAEGVMEKAVEWLREKGLAAAAKKAGRIAAEGAVIDYVTEDKTVGAIVEVNCETDFVANTDNFKNFCKNRPAIGATMGSCAMYIAMAGASAAVWSMMDRSPT